MSYIATLVDRATSTKNTKPLKVGNYSAVAQDGVNCSVVSFYHKDKHFATLNISLPSLLGVTVERYRSIPCGAQFLSALKECYPNVVDEKLF